MDGLAQHAVVIASLRGRALLHWAGRLEGRLALRLRLAGRLAGAGGAASLRPVWHTSAGACKQLEQQRASAHLWLSSYGTHTLVDVNWLKVASFSLPVLGACPLLKPAFSVAAAAAASFLTSFFCSFR